MTALPQKERLVDCPRCHMPSVYSSANPWRPFCSRRCREADLGAWASEAYRVSDPIAADEEPDAGRSPPGQPARPVTDEPGVDRTTPEPAPRRRH